MAHMKSQWYDYAITATLQTSVAFFFVRNSNLNTETELMKDFVFELYMYENLVKNSWCLTIG